LKAVVERIVKYAWNSTLMMDAFNMADLLAIIRQIDQVMEKGSSIHQGKVSISELNNSTSG
jgi:hypothetical protein